MTLLDPYGDDGQAVCAEFVKIKGKAACKYPDTPKFDISSWWPAKPQNPNIPKSEGKTFNAAHVSDFHIDLRYTIGAEADCDKGMCCTPVVENKKAKAAGLSPLVPAQKQGTYKCDSPEVLLDKGMQSVGTLAAVKDFEFAIFTGDMVSHDLDEWLSFAHTFQSEEECYYLMKKHLKDVPMYPTFGNHDSYPYAQLAQNKSGYAGDFTWNAELSAALWQDFGWIDEETEKQAAHTYGSFAVTTKRGLRVISVDSNFGTRPTFTTGGTSVTLIRLGPSSGLSASFWSVRKRDRKPGCLPMFLPVLLPLLLLGLLRLCDRSLFGSLLMFWLLYSTAIHTLISSRCTMMVSLIRTLFRKRVLFR